MFSKINRGHTLRTLGAVTIAGAAIALTAPSASASDTWQFEHVSTTQSSYGLTDAQQARVIKADKDGDSTVMTKTVVGNGNTGANLNVKDAPAGNTIILEIPPCDTESGWNYFSYYGDGIVWLVGQGIPQDSAKRQALSADADLDGRICLSPVRDGDFDAMDARPL